MVKCVSTLQVRILWDQVFFFPVFPMVDLILGGVKTDVAGCTGDSSRHAAYYFFFLKNFYSMIQYFNES